MTPTLKRRPAARDNLQGRNEEKRRRCLQALIPKWWPKERKSVNRGGGKIDGLEGGVTIQIGRRNQNREEKEKKNASPISPELFRTQLKSFLSPRSWGLCG